MTRKIGAAHAGDLLIVGARDGVGKSFLGLHILRECAELGQRGLYVSCEDTPDDVEPRFDTGLEHPLVSVAYPTGASLSQVLYCIGQSGGVVVVDYLQLLDDDIGGAAFSRENQVGTMTRRIKAAARAAGVPVVLLSQVAPPAMGEDQYAIPSRYRLREAPGAINSQATYVVMMGPESDGEHVSCELAKAKRASTGGRCRFARGAGGRLVAPLRAEPTLEDEA